MIDIHNHILYGLDDGPKAIEGSIDMLRLAIADGVEGIITTPHYISGFNEYDAALYEEHFNQLSNYISEYQLGIKLYKGNELYLDEYSVEELIEGKCLTMAGSRQVLIEWQYDMSFDILKRLLYRLRVNQYIPIIAHCERFVREKGDIELLKELSIMGCLLQVNARTVIKPRNRLIKGFLKSFFKNEMIDYIASDGHNTTSRQPLLREAYIIVMKRYGETYADHIFIENQKKIIV